MTARAQTFLRIVIGIGMVIFGIVIYPYYINYVITPLINIAHALNPGMHIWHSTMLSAIPLFVFLLVIFFGILHIIGKAEGHGGDKYD